MESKKLYRKETIFFRFEHFPMNLFSELKSVLPNSEVKANRRVSGDNEIVLIRMKEKTNYDGLFSFIDKHNLDPSNYGFWFSLVTEQESDGLHVPEYILSIQKRLGGQLNFSFSNV